MIDSLAYVVVRTPCLEAWVEMATKSAGMQAVVVQPRESVHLRLDEKIQRLLLVACEGKPSLTAGFSVRDAEALNGLKAELSAAGVQWEAGSADEVELRGVEQMIHFNDPDGNRVEVACGLRDAATAFAPGRPIGGFRTGELGLGHVAWKAVRYDEMTAFYRDLLKFRVSDKVSKPFRVEFLHVNPRHHTLALAGAGDEPGVHHLMVEYNDYDDIGRSYDLALADPDSIGVTLGRHINDHVTSFYVNTPDGWMLELGWAGRTIGPDWEVVEDLPGMSLWGHDRRWLPDDLREYARDLLKDLSAKGVRAPIAIPGQASKES